MELRPNVLGDGYFIPGYGRGYGVYVHAVGAETLKRGTPVDLGWVPGFLIALAAATAGVLRKRCAERFVSSRRHCRPDRRASLHGGAAHFRRRHARPVRIATVAIVLGWRRYRVAGWSTACPTCPTSTRFAPTATARNQASSPPASSITRKSSRPFPPNSERQLVEQIVVAAEGRRAEPHLVPGRRRHFRLVRGIAQQPFGNHLEALYALFRNPARVAGLSIDLAISFGVEVGSGRSLANRLASALVAAEEAAHDGLKWKYHDPETLENASWKLSMLSQLDEAIDRGEVWVAYQPKLDLATRRIVGAEALARWTHPEKGPIAASEFVAAAEQHNRIGKLTDFVLEKAVAAAAADQQARRRVRHRGKPVGAAAHRQADSPCASSALLARHGLARRTSDAGAHRDGRPDRRPARASP